MATWRTLVRESPLGRRGFFGKLALTLLLVLGGAYALLNFVITVTASDVARMTAKYDNHTGYVMGVVDRLGYFPDVNMPAFEMRTRMGKIWICSTKDMPEVGHKLLMESTFYCTPEKFWTRFSDELKHNPDKMIEYKKRKTIRCEFGDHLKRKPGSTPKLNSISYPVGYEMVRIRMPF